MDKRIIYSTPDNGVAIVVPTGEISIEEVLAKDIPLGALAEIVDISEIPSDRTFRNAWEKSNRSIIHNLNKAKNIAHEKRRFARAKELAPLDIEATIPSKSAQAEAKRQAIREKYDVMQQKMESASTIEELKSLLPE